VDNPYPETRTNIICKNSLAANKGCLLTVTDELRDNLENHIHTRLTLKSIDHKFRKKEWYHVNENSLEITDVRTSH